MRCVALAAALAFIACSSSTSDGTTNPTGDAFTGSYVLSTVGGAGLPRDLDTNVSNGGYDVLRSGSLSFPTSSRIAITSTKVQYLTDKSPGVTIVSNDTFDLGRLPTQAFVTRRGSVADTIGVIIVPSPNRLALDYRGAGGIGTYLFVRP